MTTETEIQEIAEAAGEHAALSAEIAVENAVSDIAQELEDAQERLDQSQEFAENIADAALASELGRQIENLRIQVTQCQNDAALAVQENQTLRQEMASLTAELSALKPAPEPLIPLPMEPEPSNLSEQVEEAVEEMTDPATAEIVVDAQPEAEKPVRVQAKRRWLR